MRSNLRIWRYRTVTAVGPNEVNVRSRYVIVAQPSRSIPSRPDVATQSAIKRPLSNCPNVRSGSKAVIRYVRFRPEGHSLQKAFLLARGWSNSREDFAKNSDNCCSEVSMPNIHAGKFFTDFSTLDTICMRWQWCRCERVLRCSTAATRNCFRENRSRKRLCAVAFLWRTA